MFRYFSRLVGALEHIADGLRSISIELVELVRAQHELGPGLARLEGLERSRHQFEAQCEGLMLKAEGQLRAARNSEARERSLRKSYEHLLDPLPEDGERPETAPPDTVRGLDARPSETEGLQPVHLDVAPSNKTLAQRAKFGVK